MHLVLAVLVDIFLALNHGEPQKLTELLEVEVGLVVVETEVNTGTMTMVIEDLTIKAVAVVQDHTNTMVSMPLMVSPTQAEVVVEDHKIMLVEDHK